MAAKKRKRKDATPLPPVKDKRARFFSNRTIWIITSAVLIVASGVAVQINPNILALPSASGLKEKIPVASFVGSDTCAGCHSSVAELWRRSQHKQAMDHATEQSVLGDFRDTNFESYGVRSRFFRKNEKFFVETDGPDGKPGEFEIKYTFGVDPLQQYLIEFPDGRLQALSIAWDARPKDKGGQRWFHLYPNEAIRHDDILHWTKLNQNWNFMCAECHSTGVRKNYDASTDRFATTWAEISVGCEACHGQGSRHVAWVRNQQSWWPFAKENGPTMGLLVRFDERKNVAWRADLRTGTATRKFAPATLRKEVETCGVCHARRSQFSESWVPGKSLFDSHMVSSLRNYLYQADGQMLDEVYNYGSFRQSKMFAAGVTCGDCHDPHSAKPRYSGDKVCLQCHASDKFAAPSHHRHAVASELTCTSCHMPIRTYMVVDPRRDHSFRIPRPDLTVKLGTTNTCNDCHADKSAEWAASAIESWYGSNRKGFQNYAAAFHAAWNNRPGAANQLAVVAGDRNNPAFARAGALSELGSRTNAANLNLARSGLVDSDPMVRIAALDMVENLPLEQRWSLASPLLSDRIHGVRIRAVSLLADAPMARLSVPDRALFESAAEEFISAQLFNADRPESRSTLGAFYARRGQIAQAEIEYKAALRLSPQFAAASINLADLYRGSGRDGEGETVIRNAIIIAPNNGALHHVLGLILVRVKRSDEALFELRRAADLEPNNARYAYVYGIALHSSGHGPEAIAYLREIQTRHPEGREILLAIINFSREAGDTTTALQYAAQLSRISPNDPAVIKLLEELQLSPSPLKR